MPFMVIYRTSDGSSKFEQEDAIDEAALFVERLRNSDGIDEVRIYRMEEISFAFRPYYKVELGLPERQTPAPTSEVVGATTVVEEPVSDAPAAARVLLDEPAVEASTPPPPPPPPPVADASAEDAQANGARRGLFGR